MPYSYPTVCVKLSRTARTHAEEMLKWVIRLLGCSRGCGASDARLFLAFNIRTAMSWMMEVLYETALFIKMYRCLRQQPDPLDIFQHSATQERYDLSDELLCSTNASKDVENLCP